MAILEITLKNASIQVVFRESSPTFRQKIPELQVIEHFYYDDGLVATEPIQCDHCKAKDMPKSLRHADPWSGTITAECRHCGELTMVKN